MELPLNVADVAKALEGVVSAEYLWPAQPAGWQLEFIAYPEVEMDFAHPVSRTFWSEENGALQTPFTDAGTPITWIDLQRASIPFMTPFGHAALRVNEAKPALKIIKKY